MPGCLLSIASLRPLLGVHPTRPAVRGPGVQPSGVQPVQCPVIWLPRPDAAVRPAGVQPVQRPAVWCLSVRPVAAVSSRVRRVVAMGETSVRRAAVTTGSSQVPCGPARPRRLGRRPEEHGCGYRCAGGVQAGGGASAADLGRVVLRREAAPDRPGRADGREERLSLATAPGQGSGWRDVAARPRAGGHLGLEPRLLCVVVVEPDVRMDGPGGTKRARRRGRRAAPARPSQVASATGSTLATP
jgi:hypothetical protein